jgi:murein DD-endopeptidase MepM/ murein hydrolase activator NlpD
VAANTSLAFAGGPTYRIDQQRLTRREFAWPAIGPISNNFGPEHPLGIDIGLALFPASQVGASADGLVIHVGGDPCCGYGLHVIIDHGDGYTTLYAHLSFINVEEGQKVRRGQALGTSGNTGLSTSEHLHFELRHNDVPLNPQHYLTQDSPLG